MNKAMIIYGDKGTRYFDKNGVEIVEGSTIRYPDGKTQLVYLTDDGYLGTDATNPKWIEWGRAVPCEYGIYPLNEYDVEVCEVVR